MLLAFGLIHTKNRKRKNGKRKNIHPKAQKNRKKCQDGSKHQNGTMDLPWTIEWTDFGES